MRHKHADLIHAWAEGAEIEWKVGNDWASITNPRFHATEEYRIKPTPKLDVVRYVVVMKQGDREVIVCTSSEIQNITSHAMWQAKVTRDGETGELIKAEVLK